MEYISAKTILSPYRGHGWFGSNYTVNLYLGCSHGCIYCDSRSECYRNEDFEIVRAKADALLILQKELASKKRKGVILTGSMGDPYNPFEAEEKLTCSMLQLIARYGFGVAVLTKSDLVTRDVELLRQIRNSLVSITVTAADDSLAKKIEPHVSSSSERFAAIKTLSDAGVNVGVTLMPTLPFLTDSFENISKIVEEAAAAGASWVYAGETLAVSLRDRQRRYFYEQLEENFPGVRERYEAVFKDQYWCGSSKEGLFDHFVSECKRCGVLYEMREIERIVLQGSDQQMKLF